MNAGCVLIVEDDRDIRENLEDILLDEGYRVMSAAHGREALDVLLARRGDLPGCIVLDLSMPVMDGVTFIKTVQAAYPDDLATIPIIVATASSANQLDPPELAVSIDYLRKPIDLNDLLDAVARHCRAPSA